ncbi:MAG TPA: CHAD domain-containing protein [Tepidisphaeraceae bacterium]|jgi:CHAD domain-containing protein
MSFQFELGESVEAGVRRIIGEQLTQAAQELRSAAPRTADAAIHSARKRLKRVRAVLRLVRGELGEPVFSRENQSLRDAAANLSEARDAAVLVTTLDELKGRIDPEAFADARKRLAARRRRVKRRVLDAGRGLTSAAATLEHVNARSDTWRVEKDAWRALDVKQTYRRARAAHQIAHVGADAELFHEWRKQVKHLWHQLEVVEPIWPKVIRELSDQAHDLADLLGKDHDLAVLKDVLEAESPTPAQGNAAPSAVVEVVDATRADLQRQAQALGARVFAERPKAFARRLAAYWRAWQTEVAGAVQAEPAVTLTPPGPDDTPPAATGPDAVTEPTDPGAGAAGAIAPVLPSPQAKSA